jgi:hypothetical protein
MRKQILILALAGVLPLLALGRAVRVYDMKDLVGGSKLVFVGKALSVEPSGITTAMSYPTWKGVTFEWLKVEVEVLEPIKGVRKGEHVRTLMLSTKGDRPVINAPGMVEPKTGRAYLLCLLPTTISNVYASLTAPWDDDQAIFLLDRKSWVHHGATYYKDGKEVAFQEQNEKNAALWNLVDDSGKIKPPFVARMRQDYAGEIATTPGTNAVIPLQWETWKAASGWQWDVPKGYGNVTNSAGEATRPNGPITFPSFPDK